MLLKRISRSNKSKLLKLTRFLFLFDQPVLWDGKKEDEIDSSVDISNISIGLSEKKKDIFNKLYILCRYNFETSKDLYNDDTGHQVIFNYEVEGWDEYFLNKVRELPLFKQNEKSARIAILEELINYNPDMPRSNSFNFSSSTSDSIYDIGNEKNFYNDLETHKTLLFFLISACVESDSLNEEAVTVLKYYCDVNSVDVSYFDEILNPLIEIQKLKQEIIDIILE